MKQQSGAEQGGDFARLLRRGGLKAVSIRDLHSPIKDVRLRDILDIDANGSRDVPADTVEAEIIQAGRSFEVTTPAKPRMSGKSWEMVHDPLLVADTEGRVYKLLWIRGDWAQERLVFYVRTISWLPFRRRVRVMPLSDISLVSTAGEMKSPVGTLPDLMP